MSVQGMDGLRFSATVELPAWVSEFLADKPEYYDTMEARMQLAISLSDENRRRETGGPFGAAVFECDSGRLVSVGVNRVVDQKASFAHAEGTALLLAQHRLGTFDLASKGLPKHELVTSAQPCIQCFGMLWWSGVQKLVQGADGNDVETLTGFNEGPLPANWVELLRDRQGLPPVDVVQNIFRDEARAVLSAYRGLVYNAGSDKSNPKNESEIKQ